MKLSMSLLSDAFLGSAVPLGGNPITSFQTVPLLDLRTGTILDNSEPMIRDVVKARFLATNCGARPLEFLRSIRPDEELDHESYPQHNAITLLPGESSEFSAFRSWDAPGEHEFTLACAARCAGRSTGQPFARLTYPPVAIHVRAPALSIFMYWVLSARATRLVDR